VEPNTATGVRVLPADECWRLLNTVVIGRLAVVIAEEPEIFPVNFVVDGTSLVFRTAEGTKLFALTARPGVAFEADGFDPDSGEAWSVVLKGCAQRLEKFSEIYAAEALPLAPWQPGVKQWFVRISQTAVTGIRFAANVTQQGERPSDW
jgi:uncharacterized protein